LANPLLTNQIRKSQRPDLADCWSRDVKVRVEARKAARIAVEKELEKKSRRITSSMWRDDGYAVDWALVTQNIVTYSYPREVRPFEQPEHLRELVIAKRTAWEEEQLKQWDEFHTDRTRGNIKRTSFKFTFEWHRRSGTLDPTVLTSGPPTVSCGQPANPAKRVRSPSPQTGRKSLRQSSDQTAGAASMPMTDNRPSEQTSRPSNSSSSVTQIHYVHDKRKLKSRAALVDIPTGVTEKDLWLQHLQAARTDVQVWSQQCLPDLTGNTTWSSSVAHESPDDVRQEAQYFIER
jgi:hypothetical protein